MSHRFGRFPFPLSGLILATVSVWACGDGGTGELPGSNLTALCEELTARIIVGAARDEIPALTDPELVSVGDPDTDYLLPTDRVIGLEIAGEYVAIPHNIL
jgi:hypothetical protein